MRFLILALAALLFASQAAAAEKCVPLGPVVDAAKQEGYGAYKLTPPQLQRFEVNFNAIPPASNLHFSGIGILDDHRGHLLLAIEVAGCIVDMVDVSPKQLGEMLK